MNNIFYYVHSKNPRRIKNSQELIISNATFSLKTFIREKEERQFLLQYLKASFMTFLDWQ